jgi:peptide/nickel transport system substrate-binding protein
MTGSSSRAQALVLAGEIVLLSLLSGAVWLAADSGTVRADGLAPGAVAVGGTLRYYSGEPDWLDPALVWQGSEIRVRRQILEDLVRLDDDVFPQPALASSWSLARDASAYTFTLDPAHFSNDRLVLAEDVVYSMRPPS